jgi:hypothetical protein
MEGFRPDPFGCRAGSHLHLVPLHRFGAVPATPTTKTPAMYFSRLNHTAFALAVYASCRGFPTTSKTRFRLVANLYRVGLTTHRDIAKGFINIGALLLPPSWAYHGATGSVSGSQSQSVSISTPIAIPIAIPIPSVHVF